VGAFGPSIGALVTRWLSEGDLRICRVWTGWGALLIGLAVGVAGFFVSAVVAPALLLVKVPLSGLNWIALTHWSTYAVNYSTFVGGPINEEPGWRGFALPRLQDRFRPYWAALILAPFWAAWHLPLFQVQGWSSASSWQFVLILIGVSFLLTAAANFSQFSVIVAIVLHAFFNTSSVMVNALTHNLPPRPYPMISYTCAVFGTGTVLGCVAIRFRSRGFGPSRPEGGR
jgi:membrane protease YdiL (CAAX protease family)